MSRQTFYYTKINSIITPKPFTYDFRDKKEQIFTKAQAADKWLTLQAIAFKDRPLEQDEAYYLIAFYMRILDAILSNEEGSGSSCLRSTITYINEAKTSSLAVSTAVSSVIPSDPKDGDSGKFKLLLQEIQRAKIEQDLGLNIEDLMQRSKETIFRPGGKQSSLVPGHCFGNCGEPGCFSFLLL